MESFPLLEQMKATARQLVAPGKGILAADESTGTIGKRFEKVGVHSSPETRRAYRELLVTAPGLDEFISGVILFDETFRQSTSDGVAFPQAVARRGMIPGIKVDKGAKPLAGFSGEKITEGLDGLRERCAEYARLGARFTKWRGVIAMGPNLPSRFCCEANAHALARFAAISQEAGLVPIVEPEVLMDGDHSIMRHLEVTEMTLDRVFNALQGHHVLLDGMLLKTNMILPGTSCPEQESIAEVAAMSVHCLERCVPAVVPGVVFLSGGQSEMRATENLDAINRVDHLPWQLSFSFGRALQESALEIWRGSPENEERGQEALLHRARYNSAARSGNYSARMEAVIPSGTL